MSPKIFVHLGLMKTGTTFLQSAVFPQLPVNYIRRIRDLKKVANGQPILISNEGLGGSIYHPSDPEGMLSSFTNSIRTINKVFVNPRIIICFREPSSFLLSSYKQYLHEGGTKRFKDFFSIRHKKIVTPTDLFFSRYVEILYDEFPKERIFIYNYQAFKDNREKVLSDLFSFIGIDNLDDLNLNQPKKGNPSIPYQYEPILRGLNATDHFLRNNFNFGLRLKLFGKILNPRIFCQYILPSIYRPKKEREITEIKEHFTSDWENVQKNFNL